MPSTARLMLLAAWRSRTRDLVVQGQPVVRAHASGITLDRTFVERLRASLGASPEGPVPLTALYARVTPLHIQVVADPAFPLPAIGLVHKRERITRHRPLHAGQAVEVDVRTTAWRTLAHGIEVDLQTVASVHGEPVWTSTTTAFRRTAPREASDAPRPADPHWPAPNPGGEPWPVTLTTARRYGWVAGNLDPIHVWPPGARLLGQRGAIVHGMWTVGRAIHALGDPAGPVTLDVRFRAPLVLPATARLGTRVDGDATHFAVWRDDGRAVLTGTLTPS